MTPPKQPRGKSLPRAAPAPELPAAPQSDDPQLNAQYFMDLLDGLAKQASPEATRIRRALVEAIEAFSAAEDKDTARLELKARLYGIEAGVAELVLRGVRKVREQVAATSRRLGTGTTLGKTARSAADGFALLVQALETMLKGAESGDDNLREQAHALLAQARGKLDALNASGS